jgi:hypothetical protein
LSHGLPVTCNHNLRGDFGERDEDKSALCQPRVRDLQAGLADLEVAQQQDIQIQRSRPVRDAVGTISAEVLFDAEELFEEG